MTVQKLEVFYDGACGVCRREMEHYRRRDRDGRLQLIDIAADGFDAAIYGRDREAFMARLHVRDAKGVFHTGVDAFAQIWAAIPGAGWTLLSKLIQVPGVHLLSTGAYALFARYRGYLPKSAGCDDGSCSTHRRPPGPV